MKPACHSQLGNLIATTAAATTLVAATDYSACACAIPPDAADTAVKAYLKA